MTVTLKFSLKDGKTPIEATIETLETEHAVNEYRRLLEHFAIGSPPPAASARGKKSSEAETGQPPEPLEGAASGNVTDIATGRANKKFSKEAIGLNETAVLLAERLGLCIPEFRGKATIEIIQQLNFNKPLASMTPQELMEVVGLIRTTLIQYSANNPGVAAYLKVVYKIDNLKEGNNEEWQAACQDIAETDWAVLQLEGNAHLLADINQHLQKRCTILQAAAAAVSA